jgi:hypothetical protein
MDIACTNLVLQKLRSHFTAESPLKRQGWQVLSGAVGQKLFERSEFFCPPLGACQPWEPEGR